MSFKQSILLAGILFTAAHTIVANQENPYFSLCIILEGNDGQSKYTNESIDIRANNQLFKSNKDQAMDIAGKLKHMLVKKKVCIKMALSEPVQTSLGNDKYYIRIFFSDKTLDQILNTKKLSTCDFAFMIYDLTKTFVEEWKTIPFDCCNIADYYRMNPRYDNITDSETDH